MSESLVFGARLRRRRRRRQRYTLKELALVDEVQRLISAKRLVPTVRTQCHRTAFQLAHTNAVRASIDTNLCLINEVQPDARDAAVEEAGVEEAKDGAPRCAEAGDGGDRAVSRTRW